MTKADFKKIPDILNLNKQMIYQYYQQHKPLAIEFSNIVKSDFKNKEDQND